MRKNNNNKSIIVTSIFCVTFIIIVFGGYFIYRDYTKQKSDTERDAQLIELRKQEVRNECNAEFNKKHNELKDRYNENLADERYVGQLGNAMDEQAECLKSVDKIE